MTRAAGEKTIEQRALVDVITTSAKGYPRPALFHHGLAYASTGLAPPDLGNGLPVEIAEGHLPESVVTAQADAAVRADNELGKGKTATGGHRL